MKIPKVLRSKFLVELKNLKKGHGSGRVKERNSVPSMLTQLEQCTATVKKGEETY